MSITQLIQLALGLVQLANWITRKIDQRGWEKSGYQKAMLEQLDAMKVSVTGAHHAAEEAKKMTPEELRRRMGDAI